MSATTHIITPKELQKLRQENTPFVLLDVREPDEYAICNLGGILIPLGELPAKLHELDKSQDYVVHCRSGGRSQKAVELMLAAGFSSVKNLVGGISAWGRDIDPNMPMY